MVFYAYELTNAMITHYNVGTTGQRDLTPSGLPRIESGTSVLEPSRPVEEVAISFQRIKVTYWTQDASGRQGEPVVFTWDVADNGSF